jgi:hypothetical protein
MGGDLLGVRLTAIEFQTPDGGAVLPAEAGGMSICIFGTVWRANTR